MIVRLGSRGSQLALAQTRSIAAAISALNPAIQTTITIIQTSGDRVLDAPLAKIGGKGLFTKEIEVALLENRIDLAVHSLKDLPTVQPEGLALGAIPRRESPRDVLLAARPIDLAALGPDAVVGTSSLRRAAQLRHRYPNLNIQNLRGNVPTRIQRMLDGRYTAIVLARAGMNRLELHAPYIQELDDDLMIPAPGQGALGLQIRAGHGELAALLSPLVDEETTRCVTAERALLDRLGGGCQLPLGAIAYCEAGGRIRLKARVVSPDGRMIIEGELVGPGTEPDSLGHRMAEELRGRGAAELIAGLDPSALSLLGAATSAPPPAEPGIIVTRDEDADGPLSRPLRGVGIAPICLPLIRTKPMRDLSALAALAEENRRFDAVLLTSARALDALLMAVPRAVEWLADAEVFSTGAATAEKLSQAGFTRVHAGEGGRDAMLGRLSAHYDSANLPNLRLLYLKGNLAPEAICARLAEWGCHATTLTVYETRTLPENAALIASMLETSNCRGIAFCSSSAVEALAEQMPEFAALVERTGALVASIGASTTATIRERFGVSPLESPVADFQALAACIAATLHKTHHPPAQEPQA